MNNKPIVFYHENCIDGLMAVSIWYHHFPFGTFKPVQYRKTPKLEEQYSSVVFLDFVPPADWVKENQESIGHLTIFDHHKTAVDDIAKIKELFAPDALRVVFDMSRSGGAITWDELEGKSRPELVQVAADFDLGLSLDEKEGFVDIFAQYLEGEDEHRFTGFYRYLTISDPLKLKREYENCAMVTTLRDQKIRWFESRMKYHRVTLEWMEGKPEVDIAFTTCPHYLISSFAKWALLHNDKIRFVVGVTLSDRSLGFSFRGRQGESYCRQVAERFGGGGHDSAAGGFLNEAVGFSRLSWLIAQGGQVKNG